MIFAHNKENAIQKYRSAALRHPEFEFKRDLHVGDIGEIDTLLFGLDTCFENILSKDEKIMEELDEFDVLFID